MIIITGREIKSTYNALFLLQQQQVPSHLLYVCNRVVWKVYLQEIRVWMVVVEIEPTVFQSCQLIVGKVKILEFV